jgi:hypothetical protein
MRLPYNKSFQGLKITKLATECCHATKGDLVRIYFQLSEPPPLGWAYVFTTVWRSLANPMKRQVGVERDAIWIDCAPDEVATCHLKELEYAVAQTSTIYCQEARKQASDQAHQAESHAQLRSKLEALNAALYPATVPHPPNNISIIAKWFRYILGNRPKPAPPAQSNICREPLDDVRDYHHGCFESATIAPDGQSLSLDYFDHEPGGTRYCFRYVVSTQSPPRLVSGYTHEDSRLDYEIPLERIPRQVFCQARHWLTCHIDSQRDRTSQKSLAELLGYLNKHSHD